MCERTQSLEMKCCQEKIAIPEKEIIPHKTRLLYMQRCETEACRVKHLSCSSYYHHQLTYYNSFRTPTMNRKSILGLNVYKSMKKAKKNTKKYSTP